MKLEVFEKIINRIVDQQERSHALYKMGIDTMGYEEGYQEITGLLLRAYYGEAGADWIEWFLYEREGVGGSINDATDADGNPICYDIPSLWKCVEEIRVSVDFKEYDLPKQKTKMTQTDFNELFGKFLGERGSI
jgi:hypothetical protein